jgi:histidinol-phosphatase
MDPAASMNTRLDFALKIAREAGQLTLKHFRTSGRGDQKSDQSPVTIADLEAEIYLRKQISEAYPGEGFMGEEQGIDGDQTHRWVIDPIDGTKSFIAGVPLYSVLLAYEVDTVTQLAVVDFPALGQTFWATLGGGAFCNGEPIHVSSVRDPKDAIVLIGSLNGIRDRGIRTGIDRLVDDVWFTRTWGDAFGHCQVACGRAEAMIDPKVAPHDVSPVRLIVREAGGKCTPLDGGTADPTYEALSSNGHLQDYLVKVLRRCD